MKQTLLERKYKEQNSNKKMEKVDLIERKELLQIMKKLTARKHF